MEIKETIPMKILSNQAVRDWIKEQTLPFRTLMSYYKCAMMEIETKFNVLNEEFSLQHDRNPIETIKTRLKSPESIGEKLQRKDLPLTCDAVEKNINDVAGVRVICSFIDDVYLLADALLKQDDIKLIKKKDYIQNPKPEGYRSLHLIIEVPIFLAEEKRPMRVEIQLRTIAMDFWASLEHQLKYKKNIQHNQYVIEELKKCAEVNAELDRRMAEIKKTLNL